MKKDNSPPRGESFIRLGLLATALVIMIAAGEIAVRVWYRALDGYDMEMWRYAREMKQRTGDAALPFINKPSAAGRYYGAEIRTNSQGCRSEELAAEKGDRKRLLFLGDSFTLGFGVPLEQTFTSLIRQRLSGSTTTWEVINAGVGNYNSLMELEWFKKYGAALQPDIVVLMFYLNDVEPTPRISGSGYFLASHSYLYALLADRSRKVLTRLGRDRYSWKKYYSHLYDDTNPALRLNREALQELAALCKQNKARLVAVNIPDLHQLQPYPFPQATRYFERVCEENGIPCVDLLPQLQPHEPARLWVSFEDTHANAFANGIIADTIFRTLCALEAVPCGQR